MNSLLKQSRSRIKVEKENRVKFADRRVIDTKLGKRSKLFLPPIIPTFSISAERCSFFFFVHAAHLREKSVLPHSDDYFDLKTERLSNLKMHKKWTSEANEYSVTVIRIRN